jgi:uncharacterized membrane protein YeaQ/YmgE (transglycosylase-associated protein family)
LRQIRFEGIHAHMGFILVLLMIGLIAGATARLVVPGRNPMGLLGTLAVGVIGAFIGWLLPLHPTSLLGSILAAVIGAVIVLLILRLVRSDRSRTRT